MRSLAFMAGVLLVLSVPVCSEERAAAEEAAASELPPNTWHGTVGCAKCDFGEADSDECRAAIKTEDGLLLLKRSAKAPPAIDSFLSRIKNGTMKGDYLCTGELKEEDGQKYLAVKTMVAKPKEKAPKEALTFSTNRRRSSASQDGKMDKAKWDAMSKEEKREFMMDRMRKFMDGREGGGRRGGGDRHRE
jgi:hypothetical protein